MWSHYNKVYTFRDCFELGQIDDELTQINDLLRNDNVLIFLEPISVIVSPDHVDADKSEDTGELMLCFSKDGVELVHVSTYSYKEVQLWFDIEENIKTGEMLIHSCEVRPFKEYQC